MPTVDGAAPSPFLGALNGKDRSPLVVAPAEESAEREVPVPELRPGREVGWIFRNGDAVAVERLGDRDAPVRRTGGE